VGRFAVKPGLTGWAQVNGSRGETPTAADMQRRVELDLWYVQNRTLALDLTILARTVVDEITRRTNAY
jgi:putative colanic acid biosynthesis UDP-glucose lipid carrier transferase